MQSVVRTTDQTSTGRMPSTQGARRTLAGGLVGAVMVGSALLGSGTASALVCTPLPVIPALAQQCKALKNTAGTATGAVKTVPKQTAPVVQAVPKVVASAPKVATGAVGGVVGGASKAATAPSKAAAAPSASSGSTAGSSSSPAGATAPAAAPAAAAPAAAWTSAPVAAASAMTYTTAFDSLPASFLSSAAPGAGVSALGSFGTGAAYDPGLLLTSSTPLRALAPSPVTSGSTASPMSFLSDDGQFGTPVLLSVLSVAVVAALGVRSGVLRRVRRRSASA